jgi:hypothetical protein
MTYVCTAWDFAADSQLMKLQRLQNKGLHITGRFPRRIAVIELLKACVLPHVYDSITKLFKQQAEVIQEDENTTVRDVGQGEARHRKCKNLKLSGGQAYDRSSD